MARIALLEDESALREELAAFLHKRGHTPLEAGTLAEFWPLMPTADLAIIDLMLPDGSGFEAAALMREAVPCAGIIMLTARSATEDKLQGLYGGADHYLVKPFRLLELMAIVDALLRRVGAGWRLAVEDRRLISPEGFSSALSAAEATLLDLLATHPQRMVSRRELVEALGYDWLSYDLRRLDKLVSRFRSRWLAESGQELPLKTEYGQGFRFGTVIQRL